MKASAKNIRINILQLDISWRFLVLHIIAIALSIYSFTPRLFLLFIVGYYLRIMGVSIAFHKYFSHRSFKTTRVFQFILALWGASSGQRGALWWAANHRYHHQYADSEDDVHSPHHNSFFHSHIGWVLNKSSLNIRDNYIRDFSKFPELKWLDNNLYIFYIVQVIATFGALKTFNWLFPELSFEILDFFLWSTVLPTLASNHMVLALNSLNHLVGSKDYESQDESTNIWWLFPFLLGENWHNNHHAFPSTASCAFEKGQMDLMYIFLLGLEKIGVVWDVKRPPTKKQLALRRRIS